jgi:hypothetical protein
MCVLTVLAHHFECTNVCERVSTASLAVHMSMLRSKSSQDVEIWKELYQELQRRVSILKNASVAEVKFSYIAAV